jgi:hypothetical protein
MPHGASCQGYAHHTRHQRVTRPDSDCHAPSLPP